MIELKKLEIIRVIVNEAPNFGNQKACITLMHRLRELGFDGTFDVRFEEKPQISYDGNTRKIVTKPNNIGQRLETLIKGFKQTELDSDEAYLTQHIDHPTLGKLNITRLPYINQYEVHDLPGVELACTGADDDTNIYNARKYKSKIYLTFQPTGWQNSLFHFSEDPLDSYNAITFSKYPRDPGLRKDFTIYKFEKTVSVFTERKETLIALLSKLHNQSELKVVNNIDVESLISEIKAAPETEYSLKMLGYDLRDCYPSSVLYKSNVVSVLQKFSEYDTMTQFKSYLEEILSQILNIEDTNQIQEIVNDLMIWINQNIALITSRTEELLDQAKQLIIKSAHSCINFKNKELRLSCTLDARDKFNDISPMENKILNICERKDLRPQLVYPYPQPISWPKKVMELLFKAHIQVMNNSPEKQTPVLIMPRDLDIEHIKEIAKDNKINLIIADIRNNDDIPQHIDKNTIVIMRTGPIDPRVFDNLLARKDFFPAVIEGCNSIETCEYAGAPYINAARFNDNFRKFDGLNKTHQKQQDVQFQASRCLEEKANYNEYFPALTQYLQESRNSDFQDYHVARQIAYEENLADAVENAFSLLEIYQLAKPLSKSNRSITKLGLNNV